MGTLHSKPVYIYEPSCQDLFVVRELRLISFSAITGNKYCHGNTFLCFMDLNIFMGSLHSISLHELELISFSAIPGNKFYHGNTYFSVSWTYKYFHVHRVS